MAKQKSKRRAVAKATQSPANPGTLVLGQYDAGRNGRRMAEWRAPSSGPNKAIQGLSTIRNRSRDAGRNEWTGASSGRVKSTSLIGTGIVARPKTKNKDVKKSLTEKYDKFLKACDAEGVLDGYGQQVLAALSWDRDGEVFARNRSRRLSDGLPVPMQVQLLEADMCPTFDADSWPDLPPKNRIRSGIELDRVGRRVAYWMYREHPGEAVSGVAYNDLVRIPADQIIHVFEPTRAGQLRGVPNAAPILAKLRTVMNFEDAVLVRQQIANLFTMFVERPVQTTDGANIDPLTGREVQYTSDGAAMASLEPGTSHELLPGEKVNFSDPPDAGANYGDYMRQQNLGIAAGQGIPYELLTGDTKDVSDRVLRIIVNEFRRYIEQKQWTIFIPQFCEKVRAWWAQAGLISGALSQEEFEEAFNTRWAPQAWARIHPTQDVDAEIKEIDAGIRSRSSVIGSRGDDPDDVDEERAEDKEREDELGLTPPPPPAPGELGGQPDDEDDDDKPKPKKPKQE